MILFLNRSTFANKLKKKRFFGVKKKYAEKIKTELKKGNF